MKLLDDFNASYPHGRLGERYRALRQLDAAGEPKVEATILERVAVEALNDVKAWADTPGAGLPTDTRMKVDAVLMTYEQRRIQRPRFCQHADPFVYCPECKVDPCPLGLGKPPAEAERRQDG